MTSYARAFARTIRACRYRSPLAGVSPGRCAIDPHLIHTAGHFGGAAATAAKWGRADLKIGGAGVPWTELLPEMIRQLARRNAVGLRPERFKADRQGLVTALKEQLAAAEKERAAQTDAERKAAETSRQEAEAQAAARARAAEERGRAQAAAGLSAEEIRKAEELASWEFVKERNDIQDLRDHLARFPGGTTERYALSKLDGLVWAGLGTKPATEQLRAYVDEFPKGANAEVAQARIATMEKEAADARVAEQIRTRETAEWSAVAASTNKEVLEAFLKQWPNGQHAQAARARVAELEPRTGTLSYYAYYVGVAIVVAMAVAGALKAFTDIRDAIMKVLK